MLLSGATTALWFAVLIGCTSGQGFTFEMCNGCEPDVCCKAFLMDRREAVALDNSTSVGPGTVYGLQVNLCENVSFTLSLWSLIPGSATNSPMYEQSPYILIYPGVVGQWRTKVVNGETWIYTNFPQPWLLDRPYVIGITTTGDRIPIPYGRTVGRQPPLLEETGRDTSGGNVRIITRWLNYPRSFRTFITFCMDPKGCPEEEGCTQGCRGPPGAQGAIGPPGPPGPPGSNPIFGCDDPDGLGFQINEIDSRTKLLLDQVAKLETTLIKVRNDRETGICPVDFVSGAYGLGYCYYFTEPTNTNPRGFGESALRCAGTEDSRLVDIENEAEELYLAETIVAMFEPNETNRTFWTAGIYSEKFGGWVWYDERLATRKTFFYQNWAAGEPRETNPFKKCLVLRVFSDKTSDWMVANCNSRHQFICKKVKKCF